jgi:hypothetical protein
VALNEVPDLYMSLPLTEKRGCPSSHPRLLIAYAWITSGAIHLGVAFVLASICKHLTPSIVMKELGELRQGLFVGSRHLMTNLAFNLRLTKLITTALRDAGTRDNGALEEDRESFARKRNQVIAIPFLFMSRPYAPAVSNKTWDYLGRSLILEVSGKPMFDAETTRFLAQTNSRKSIPTIPFCPLHKNPVAFKLREYLFTLQVVLSELGQILFPMHAGFCAKCT